jgi:hypothetical protein
VKPLTNAELIAALVKHPPESPAYVSVITPGGTVLYNCAPVHGLIGPSITPANGKPLDRVIVCAAGEDASDLPSDLPSDMR